MTRVQQESCAFMRCQLIYVNESQQIQIESLKALIAEHKLPIVLETEQSIEKLTQKRRQQLSQTSTQPILLLDDNNALSWLSNGLSVAPDQ